MQFNNKIEKDNSCKKEDKIIETKMDKIIKKQANENKEKKKCWHEFSDNYQFIFLWKNVNKNSQI